MHTTRFTPTVCPCASEPEAAGHAALFFHGLMHDSDLSNGRLAQRLTDWGVRASIDRPRRGTRAGLTRARLAALSNE